MRTLMIEPWLRRAAIALAAALVMGCALPPTHPPDAAPPELPAGWQLHATASAPAPADRLAWWRQLQDPQLEALQAQALQANRDIARAALLWQQALRRVDQGQLARWPQPSLGLNSSASRPLQTGGTTTQVQVGGVSVPVTTSAGVTTSFGLGLGASYEVDLWQRVAEGGRADAASVESARNDIAMARWLVSTQVAERYWNVTAVDAQLPVLREQLANAVEALQITKLRVANGKLLPLDTDKASSAVAEADSRLATLAADRQVQVHALALLLAQTPQTLVLAQPSLPEAPLPDVAPGAPAQVLEQRPDVRQARLAVDAALHRLNAAEADRYPRLSLSANIGTGGPNTGDWLRQPLGSLASSLMIPMIDWRRLDLARDGARTELDLAALALRDALHKALADVEAQFAEQTRLQRTGAVLDAHARETRQAEQNALVRYDAGAIGRLDWLQARNATLASELDRINQRLKAWQNLVTLHKALGGPV